jgi:hypothetical protein
VTHPVSESLSAYLDGDLGPEEAREVEAHLSECAVCSALLRDLEEIQERARSLPDRFPDRDLWPQIARSIHGWSGETEIIRLHPEMEPEPGRVSGRGFSISYFQAAAAIIALSLFSGAMGAFLMGSRSNSLSSFPVPENEWVTMVSQASPSLDGPAREVARLESLLDSHRSELDPATIMVLERNLDVIDQAIRDCVRALEADPENRFLESHLAQAMETKASYLREAASFVAPVS